MDSHSEVVAESTLPPSLTLETLSSTGKPLCWETSLATKLTSATLAATATRLLTSRSCPVTIRDNSQKLDQVNLYVEGHDEPIYLVAQFVR